MHYLHSLFIHIKFISTQDYKIEVFFRESWLDTRLGFVAANADGQHKFALFRNNKTQIGLHESYANFLWHPDTIVRNALHSENPKDTSISHRSLLRWDTY